MFRININPIFEFRKEMLLAEINPNSPWQFVTVVEMYRGLRRTWQIVTVRNRLGYKSIIYLWPMSMNWSRWCSNHHLCANTVSWPKSCIFRCLKSARHHQPLRQCENKESWSRRKILKFQDLVKIWQDFWQQHTLMSLAGSYDNILEQLEPLLRSD